ncbi:MAG: hypothetical protein H6R10_602 [Rhodocyclaceae bacterium]|nr:hypothetical protein [Rhodocyclaceae bacterium]
MFRFSRAYQTTAEFLGRQGGFDFAVVTDAVLAIVTAAKKALTGWWKTERPRQTAPAVRFHQLVLELDRIAQMPLFGPAA